MYSTTYINTECACIWVILAYGKERERETQTERDRETEKEKEGSIWLQMNILTYIEILRNRYRELQRCRGANVDVQKEDRDVNPIHSCLGCHSWSQAWRCQVCPKESHAAPIGTSQPWLGQLEQPTTCHEPKPSGLLFLQDKTSHVCSNWVATVCM